MHTAPTFEEFRRAIQQEALDALTELDVTKESKKQLTELTWTLASIPQPAAWHEIAKSDTESDLPRLEPSFFMFFCDVIKSIKRPEPHTVPALAEQVDKCLKNLKAVAVGRPEADIASAIVFCSALHECALHHREATELF